MTKTDLYPAWRRIVELDRQHLAKAGIDLPMIPVSSFLRLRAWRSPALNEESGFAPLFDWLRAAVLEAAAKQAVAAATRDLGFAQEQLRLEVAAEQQVLAKPEASEEVVGALRRRSERTRKLVERGNGWQQFLFDGIDQLIADVKHDLAGRMRTVVRDVEAVIDQGDPKESWSDIEVWLQRQVVRAANENHELLNERAAALAADVAETFALESDEPLQLGLTAPVDVLRGLTFDPAQPPPDSQKLVRMLFAGRAALIPATVAGSVASAAGGLLLLAAAAPIILGVGFIGRKLIRDERQRQLTYRRQQAKMSCRRYLDEANFVIEKDCLDSLRRTRRELRDEFQARAGVLHASSQRALSSAERAASLSPQERDAAGRGAGRPRAPRSSGSGRRPRRPGEPHDVRLPAGRPADRRGPRAVSAARDRALDPNSARPARRRRRAAVRAPAAGDRRPGEGRQVDAAQRPGRGGAGPDRRRRVHQARHLVHRRSTPRRSPRCTRTGGASSARSAARAGRWRSTWAAPPRRSTTSR